MKSNISMKEIYFAGGCFWGTEHYFKQIDGVISTEVGYANGNTEHPTYEEVYTDTTGYAECVKVEYAPDIISLKYLVELFFRSINPLSLNQQGNDCGTRYRTGVYYTDCGDIEVIEAVFKAVEESVGEPLVVELKPLKSFYAAEEYHQDYLGKNPNGYCHIPTELMMMARLANKK